MKVIAVTSGGLDSISMGLAMLEEGREVLFLHFDYGQKCELGEGAAVIEIVYRLKKGGESAEARIVDVSGLFEPFATVTSLISEDRAVLEGMDSLVASKERAGDDLWVPARNLIFLSIAAGYAEFEGADIISWGANQSETSYPDNTAEFAQRMTAAIEYGTLKHAEVVAPLYHLDKAEILKWGYRRGYGWVYEHTWSCDNTPDKEGRPCGVCGCCCNRKLAFRFAGLTDGREYADPDYFEKVFLPAAMSERRGLWFEKYLDCG